LQALAELAKIAEGNEHQKKSLLGQGFHDTHTPGVILRNILENPAWYTAYTPYQAEISQGRMEMLLNYQTMICELTGMQMANASLLDEGSAAAESLSMCHALHAEGHAAYFVDAAVHPATLAVVRTRASVLGMAVHVGDPATFDFVAHPVSGALLQLPGTAGDIRPNAAAIIARIKGHRLVTWFFFAHSLS
jgi:glycine dehydrogenase